MWRVWIRCFIVSAVIAAVAPLFSMTLAVPGYEGQVVDLSAIDVDFLAEGAAPDSEAYFQTLPTVMVDGLHDRFVSVFSHPQIVHFYLRASLTWFVGLFVATILVGYLGVRDRWAAQSHKATVR